MATELKLYLPIILQDIAEYNALSTAESPFTSDLEERADRLVEDSFLTTMSESRLIEWENALGIIPTNSSIEQRRSVLLSRFRGIGKLNKSLIQAIVKAFTGGTASVTFETGLIRVKVAPPGSTFQDFSTESLRDELYKRKPAHLLLNVELAYITWEQVKSNYSSWSDIAKTFADWEELSVYYITQEG